MAASFKSSLMARHVCLSRKTAELLARLFGI